MKDIAILGRSEFTLGFRLVGIRKVIDVSDQSDPSPEMNVLLADQTLGIVVVEDALMAGLDDYTKEKAVNSLSPVVVVVGKEARQDELRKMIIQSIGVDLMKDEEKG
ncbi:MAG TPA: V-type ATP synthase subunit F [Candidatus Nanoarchaeia archaeon]|nr:V-type ATP synthase subunit F [Candidatus Nanoarchaeia archaeon]